MLTVSVSLSLHPPSQRVFVSFQRSCGCKHVGTSQIWITFWSRCEWREAQTGLYEGHLAQVRTRSCTCVLCCVSTLTCFFLQLFKENIPRSLQNSAPPQVQVPHPPPTQVHLLRSLHSFWQPGDLWRRCEAATPGRT